MVLLLTHRRCDFRVIDACKFICISIHYSKMGGVAKAKAKAK